MSVLEGQKIIPSGNGFAFLENFTKQIYGDRGRFDRNLERYFHSKEWCEGCRHVESVEEVPLITEEQIKQQIQWETAMRGKALQMQRFVAERHGELSDEDYCAIAADMGLAPSPCRWEETLFPHVVNLWVSSEEDENAIQKQVEEHKQLIAIMGNMMMDTLSDRQIISYPQPGTGRLRAMLSQGYARNFYRGENAFFGKSRPSLYRNIPSDSKEAVIHRIIGFTRMYEFSMWIEKIDCVSRWPYGDVFHGAVAQHYGVPTNGLDITSDLKVALFFACCTFDRDLGSWRPLKKEEFENAASRPIVARLGGDSRYGMIFCAPVDISLMSQELNDTRLHLTCPTPVGYQPFMRCEHQSAYIIEAGEPYDLYLDETFSKFKFHLTEGLCQWIYQEMGGGLAIYPNEGLTDCLSVIDDIIRLEQYSEEALEAAVRNYVPDISMDEAIIVLKSLFSISGCTAWLRIFLSSKEKSARNTGCIPSIFDAAGRKKTRSGGVPGDAKQALRSGGTFAGGRSSGALTTCWPGSAPNIRSLSTQRTPIPTLGLISLSKGEVFCAIRKMAGFSSLEISKI